MTAMFKPKLALAIALVLVFCTAAVVYHDRNRTATSTDTILLLLPDSANDKDPQVQLWLDAAQEEGFHLQIVRDSEFLDPMFQRHTAGLIVPDEVHRQANDALIGSLHRFVEQGGKLMIVYDACVWDLQERYARNSSRLSDLAGIDYALYDRFGTKSIASGSVWGNPAAMQQLAIPPGSYSPLHVREGDSAVRKAALHSGTASDDRDVLVGYLYGELDYSSYRTAGEYAGKTLLWSDAGVVAGENEHGLGDVLFVNLPLGYLETRTDGMFLHSFLRYFAMNMMHLPYLASVPDGIGGLVMNWHIDAASALKHMETLRKAGVFDQGPFSLHFTAGPDVDEFHDGKGLDLQDKGDARNWVQYFEQRGDEVGSHGGWIHNYFGRNLSDTNQDSFRQYLVLNKDTVEAASGRSVREYSAPLGNHPEWVTRWLENNGIVGYYFAGDAGMGPTRVYRDHGRDGEKIWAFPILHYGVHASLEEMYMDGVPASDVHKWLLGITDFSSRLHLVRLLYSHPIGASRYVEALQKWLQRTRELAGEQRFRWYTMTQIANFMNAREQVTWKIENHGRESHLVATHPETLEHQTWMLPDTQYAQPHVVKGAADIHDQDGYWIVAAKDCKLLNVALTEGTAGNTNPQAGN